MSLCKTNLFVLVLYAIMKSVEGFGLFFLNLVLFGSWLTYSWFYFQLLSLGIGHLFLVNLSFGISFRSSISHSFMYLLFGFNWYLLNHVLIWIFDIICTTLFLVTPLCAFLVYLVFCPTCISFGSLKSLHAYLLMCMLWHA